MKEAIEFLKHCPPFYLATIDGAKPQVRPFGAVCEYEDQLYILTENKKNVYRQMKEYPDAAISGMWGDKWIRINGRVEEDSRREARQAMLDENKAILGDRYSADDGLMTVFRFVSGTATVYSFTEEPVTYQL
ncbi:NimC/NimA family protein [Megasphaera sp. AM44-1BH]|uniref:pyridoxamine 5'-phosphate oxidase family protein n=1 Tax=Megasphaera sp. AM44-1BH TaxID=2292358 RepID=UPI000E4C1AF5|nr:pyridoxamine 5'-phosphate oxidase family protein [Megasphaera sp. AM44-1BH]RHA10926.1 NimC/NimA family protein [Megasphaera sp. AM44-1BH]